MIKVLYIILISLFSLTVISCKGRKVVNQVPVQVGTYSGLNSLDLLRLTIVEEWQWTLRTISLRRETPQEDWMAIQTMGIMTSFWSSTISEF